MSELLPESVVATNEAWMAHRTSVLVVDDDQAIREVIAEVLRDEGYEVLCAENGLQALRELHKEHHPDLVLLDLMMPVMSGWEVLEELQADAELSRIPVVVVSAMNAPGACEHLAKPIDLERLLATVVRLTR
jgi:two-component system, OmpR family, response regulator CpxR